MNRISIEEAAKALTTDLLQYAGPEGWHAVGHDDTQIIIYAKTRKRANDLLAFIGYKQHGYKVVGKTLPGVTLIPKVPFP